MDAILAFLEAQGPILLYGILGAGAAVENFFPPIPADTFVLLGALLASAGRADARVVFVVTWLANTLSAMLVYGAGYRFGRPFFQTGAGRYILNQGQLDRLRRFYDRWGLPAIFFARFLPGLRAMVPVFAGVTHQSLAAVLFPVLVASGIWYGGLVWLGAATGRNLDTLTAWVGSANRALLLVALVIGVALGIWWLRSRRRGGKGGEE